MHKRKTLITHHSSLITHHLSLIILLACLLVQCKQEKGVRVDVSLKPYKKLSEYGFFKGSLRDLTPNDRVIPYDLNTPLFSDYAEKARFVWVPEGKSAQYRTDLALDFPLGTVLIKNFYHSDKKESANSLKNIIETRLLVNRGEKWDALTYVWNEEQTEAALDVVGGVQKVHFTSESGEYVEADYVIPNKNQCKGCHEHDKAVAPLGPRVRNLNRNFNYADGPMNQLQKWAQLGILSGYEHAQAHPRMAVWNDESTGSLKDRTLAYLDVNCGHCHSNGGPAASSGLYLTWQQELGPNLGIYKPPVSAAKGSGGNSYDIVPGEAGASILPYRMESLDPGAMMPEIGRTMVHDEGLELVKAWINSLNPEDFEDFKPGDQEL